jgi:hypothetical protein
MTEIKGKLRYLQLPSRNPRNTVAELINRFLAIINKKLILATVNQANEFLRN